MLEEQSKAETGDGSALLNNETRSFSVVICFIMFAVATRCPAREEMDSLKRRQTNYSESRLGPQTFVCRGSISCWKSSHNTSATVYTDTLLKAVVFKGETVAFAANRKIEALEHPIHRQETNWKLKQYNTL